jgi:hypothetical protein
MQNFSSGGGALTCGDAGHGTPLTATPPHPGGLEMSAGISRCLHHADNIGLDKQDKTAKPATRT